MNGVLVLGRCGIDDIPVRYFELRAEAEEFAMALQPEQIQEIAAEIFNLDTSIFHAVSIVEFLDGVPIQATMVKSYGEGCGVQLPVAM